MGYQIGRSKRWANTEDVVLHASAERVANGSGAGMELGDRTTVRLLLDVTAKGADVDETLDVTVETSHDGATWRSLGAFAQKTAVGSERKSFAGCDRFVRVSYTVGGTTPSFTFSVEGEAA
jgi:hypothetical protein